MLINGLDIEFLMNNRLNGQWDMRRINPIYNSLVLFIENSADKSYDFLMGNFAGFPSQFQDSSKDACRFQIVNRAAETAEGSYLIDLTNSSFLRFPLNNRPS